MLLFPSPLALLMMFFFLASLPSSHRCALPHIDLRLFATCSAHSSFSFVEVAGEVVWGGAYGGCLCKQTNQRYVWHAEKEEWADHPPPLCSTAHIVFVFLRHFEECAAHTFSLFLREGLCAALGSAVLCCCRLYPLSALFLFAFTSLAHVEFCVLFVLSFHIFFSCCSVRPLLLVRSYPLFSTLSRSSIAASLFLWLSPCTVADGRPLSRWFAGRAACTCIRRRRPQRKINTHGKKGLYLMQRSRTQYSLVCVDTYRVARVVVRHLSLRGIVVCACELDHWLYDRSNACLVGARSPSFASLLSLYVSLRGHAQ